MDREQINRELLERTERAERVIRSYLPPVTGMQQTVLDAMDYSIQAGGKRLRPIFLLETYRILGGTYALAEPFAAALEMIHTYSLVHDDLPAMDDDKYRRGKLTTHAKYGEAMGILAGDGLLTLAFETATKGFALAQDFEEYRRVARAIEVLSHKAGAFGMLGGQVIDVESEGRPGMTLEKLETIHALKTAALIEAAFVIGAILAGAHDEQIDQLEQAAHSVGVAFQIQDDILDVTSTQEVLGKPIGSDEKNGKITYVTLCGLEESSLQVQRLSEHAVDILRSMPGDSEFLEGLIELLTVRKK